jgi:hypothetical protein
VQYRYAQTADSLMMLSTSSSNSFSPPVSIIRVRVIIIWLSSARPACFHIDRSCQKQNRKSFIFGLYHHSIGVPHLSYFASSSIIAVVSNASHKLSRALCI